LFEKRSDFEDDDFDYNLLKVNNDKYNISANGKEDLESIFFNKIEDDNFFSLD
jgi:hypothetical protein